MAQTQKAHYDTFLSQLADENVELVDFRFTDLRGVWHHMTFPARALDAETMASGIFFDGSSIAGWCPINHSDTLLKPDVVGENAKVILDPFASHPTAIVFCDVYDPLTGAPYAKDPRAVARRAEKYLAETGIATHAFFGPEAEFFIFDGVRFGVEGHHAFYELSSDEFPHNSGVESEAGNHGYRPARKGGYFPCAPIDSAQDIRSEMLLTLDAMGVEVEKHHHEVAPAQHELGIRFNPLVRCADAMQIYKYVVRNVAHAWGKTACFMPKPFYGDNGSGMHVHQSLWRHDTPLFAGKEYAGLSEEALFYIGGILHHAKSLNAFTNPTTNSYKRLVPGYEAPVMCAYSAQNRSAACRIPLGESPKAKRIEVRFPDPTANGYLAFAAMMMAGLDGIQRRLHPGEPKTQDLYHTSAGAHLPTVSHSLREALHALEGDHHYLLQGGVFNQELIESYAALKWAEVEALEMHPQPIEFLYAYTL